MAMLIGKKVGMTSVFNSDRKSIACTLVEAGPCVVTQIKTDENDGYSALQLGFGDKKEKNTTQPELKHFEKAGTTPKYIVAETEYFEPTLFNRVETQDGDNVVINWEEEEQGEPSLGDSIDVRIFRPGDFVDVVGKSKGKGFQGVVKRHGFRGVGGRTHGQHNRERAPGSLGPGSTPSRVFKGMRMGGRMGGDRVKITNLEILKVIPEKNLLVISGCIPGHNGSYVFIEK